MGGKAVVAVFSEAQVERLELVEDVECGLVIERQELGEQVLVRIGLWVEMEM